MITRKVNEWCEITIPNVWEHITIEEILREEYKLPKKTVHQMRMDKEVYVNGECIPWNEPLKVGDVLSLKLFIEEEIDIIPEYDGVEVLFEDDHICIVNKPKNMDVHPNESGQIGTLANLVAGHFKKNGVVGKPRHIHRLDRDTTGGVIFAKHAVAGAIMDRLLAERAIKRLYLARVHGSVVRDKGTISQPIGRDRHHATRRRVSPSGQDATTHYEVIERIGNETIVSVELETGRTHQIRVHMSYLGHPLVGDTLYGGKNHQFATQELHAYKIICSHPITFERIEVEIPK